jgi:hypothetical protein
MLTIALTAAPNRRVAGITGHLVRFAFMIPFLSSSFYAGPVTRRWAAGLR